VGGPSVQGKDILAHEKKLSMTFGQEDVRRKSESFAGEAWGEGQLQIYIKGGGAGKGRRFKGSDGASRIAARDTKKGSDFFLGYAGSALKFSDPK
jgi:hypothetical protein